VSIMPAQVVVLGGGVGGTIAANLVSKELGAAAKVTLIDRIGMHVYQPGFLYVALGQANGRWLEQDERRLLRDDVELMIDRAVRIDPEGRTIELARGGASVTTISYWPPAPGSPAKRSQAWWRAPTTSTPSRARSGCAKRCAPSPAAAS
jgi:NADPH-dependent 2,4-dienoyl-CoA reductase/sulfur reductase-like enzyme